MKPNVDLDDDDWGHFVSTDGIDMAYNGQNYNGQNYNGQNYNAHTYNIHNYTANNYTAHNYNLHDRDVNTYECVSSCLPILASVCVIGTVVVQATLSVCWQAMP
jgi:hypothetical protein